MAATMSAPRERPICVKLLGRFRIASAVFSSAKMASDKRRGDGADGISQAEEEGHDVEHADILAKQDEDKGKGKGDASKGSTGHTPNLSLSHPRTSFPKMPIMEYREMINACTLGP